MIKKCIVVRDELGNPVDIIELKEFTSSIELSSFKSQCEINKKAQEERMALENEKKLQKEKELNDKLSALEEKIETLNKYLISILGVEKEEEIGEVLDNGTI